MGLALLSVNELSLADGHWTARGALGCLAPLLGIAATVLHPEWAEVAVIEHNGLRAIKLSSAPAVLIFACTIYTFAAMFVILFRAARKVRRAGTTVKEMHRIRALIWGGAVTCSFWTAATLLNALLVSNGQYELNNVSFSCILIWAFAVRYAMVKFDFLASEGRRYELLFELSHSGIVLLDDKGRIVEANTSFRRLAGLDPGEPIEGQLLSSLVKVADWREIIKEYRESQAALKPFHREVEVVNAAGKAFIVDVARDYIEVNGKLYVFLATRDITEQKNNERKLAELAYQDPLTGLANRRQFISKLQEALYRARRINGEIGIMMIDLDQFKWLNDTLGHSTGDRLLREIARKLRETVPPEGTVARLGGDEFAVLVPADFPQVIGCAKSIILAVSEPVSMQGRLYTITASIGISIAPQDGDDFETLIRNADTALFVAKTGGRNRYQLFMPQLMTRAEQHLTVVSGLAHAIAKEEFALHYQPQIDLRTGAVLGVEALLRWNSAELGPVSPSVFIPIAEETSMILPIGEWVLRTAVLQAKRWVDEGYDDLVVSVNISACQLREPLFAAHIAGLLAEAGLPPGNLCLEITETTAISDVETSRAICGQLTGMGIRLAIDDFGMGYSSISMLNRFPFHFTKVDRSLVQDIVHNNRDLAVLRAVIKLAQDLGMQVVAEGVETEEQHEMLRSMHCHEGQGYLYGQPMSSEQITAFLNERRCGRMFGKGTA
jgi:diguanylate cyclase (GGDEF)-like protein/PAS domain S-box-containing protein